MILSLSKLLNIPELQKLVDQMYRAANIPFALIDLEGNVLVGAGWQPICVNFHRECPETLKLCLESDKSISARLKNQEKYVLFQCPLGLVDAATPLIIQDQHLGNVFTGQLLFHEPDREYFKRQAQKYGFDEKKYQIAVDQIPIFDKQQVIWNLEFLVEFSKTLATRVQEIYQYKLVEKQLKESEFKYRKISQNIPFGLWISAKSGEIELINKTFTQMFGYKAKDIPTVFSWLEKAYPDATYREKALETYKKDIEKNIEVITDPWIFEVVCKDKTLKTIAFRHIPLTKLKFMTLFEDITEKRKIEQDRLRSQKIESIALLAGGIAHDFNNSLTGILGNIELLKDFKLTPEDFKEILTDLEFATKQARSFSTQLLTFSKGGAPLKKQQSIESILRDSSKFIFRGSKSKLKLQIDNNLLSVDIDSGQISQVFNNILLNAIQATSNGGIVTVKATLAKESNNLLRNMPKQEYIHISFQDNGEGIKKENQEKIFQPYFTTKSRGNGLGLATAYSIIKNHGGNMSFISQEGVGTTFYLVLPCSTINQVISTKSFPDFQKFLGKSIIMDDEELITKTLGNILDRLGSTVDFSSNGEDCLNLISTAVSQGNPYNVAFLDLIIPGEIGGKHVVQELRQISPSTKVIVFSGYSSDQIMANYKDYGFDGRLHKPFTLETLKEVLYKVGKEWVS